MAKRADAAGVITRAAWSKDNAIAHLAALWCEEHNKAMQEWVDWKAADEAACVAEEDLEKERAEKVAQDLAEEHEKKRVKIPPFVSGAWPAGAKAFIPHKYTYNALLNRTHFSLWHLTVLGLATVTKSTKACKGTAIAEEGSLLNLGGGSTLTLPSLNAAPVCDTIEDCHLPWSKITFAVNNWVFWMQCLSYEDQHIKAWMSCVIQLQSSTKWRNMHGLGDLIITRYFDDT
jgi:hypothetical protein